MPNELSRRLFMKLLALSSAAAAGCTEPPTRELVPYVIPDENVIPGVPTFYAGICGECPAGCSMVARVREGRVIKLEGNPKDPISAGSLCARGQAALQGLYNPDRLATPHQRDPSGTISSLSWEAAMWMLTEHLRHAANNGKNRVAFIGSAFGPTTDGIIARWLQFWGSGRRLYYEALDEAAARAAGELCFGRTDLPVYQLDRADVLLSFGADFLETWRSPVELTRQYAAFRSPGAHGAGAGIGMGYSVYVGPHLGLTAANCDSWWNVRPGAEALVALSILHVLASEGLIREAYDVDTLQRVVSAYDPESVGQRTGVSATKIRTLAKRFGEAKTAIALAGTTDSTTHVAALLLNALTGNVGKTMRFLNGEPPPHSSPEELRDLMAAMQNGALDVLIVAGANPVFTAPAVTEAFERVPFIVWCGGVPDETAEKAHLLLPIHHTLEAWSDAAPRPGVRSLGQPVMQPVFQTLPLGDILLASAQAAGASKDMIPWEDTRDAVETTWRKIHEQTGDSATFTKFWQDARADGGVFNEAATEAVRLRPDVFNAPMESSDGASKSLSVVVFPHIFFYDGRGADKPWLQEVPEPVSQIVWDSWAAIHPSTAKRLAVEANDIITLRSEHGHIEAPAYLTEHVHTEVIAVPIGQGHTAYGRYARNRGANPWQLLSPGSRTATVEVQRTGRKRRLVSPLLSPHMHGRPIVETIALDELRSGLKPKGYGLAVLEPYQIRPQHVYPKHKWGMTIDINACTGCSACVTACYAENNLNVVGKEEVGRGHIKSWMRIERYVPTTENAPLLYLMPMLCQQCDNAPCESVCPVYASVHTEDGLNGQIYNRCIGTRYCENNCPYKVRRFNWFKPEWPKPLDLQLNPDVTVRGAGVMEKCTFCVQRIRAAEMNAKAEGRSVQDGEITPACAEACPAKAITFGDIKEPESAMMQRRADHPLRQYRALEELNTQPAIVYLREIYRPQEA